MDHVLARARDREDPSQRGERGQDLVEFALVLPLLVLLFFGIIEFGRAVFTYNTLANAAREGARFGIVVPTTGDAGNCVSPPADTMRAAACRLTSGLAPASVIVTPTVATQTVSVEVRYGMQLLILPNPLNLRAQSTMQREQY